MEHARLTLLTQAIPFPSDVNRRGGMHQPVEHGRGKDSVRHHVTPFTRGFITGQDDAPLLLPTANQAKQNPR